jgi:hypothetical protein
MLGIIPEAGLLGFELNTFNATLKISEVKVTPLF